MSDQNWLLRQVYEASTSVIERGGYANGPYLLVAEEVMETNRKAAEALALPVAVNLREEVRRLAAENAAQAERIGKLEEALKPFAEAEEYIGDRMPDNSANVMCSAIGINLGHIRRARAALEPRDE